MILYSFRNLVVQTLTKDIKAVEGIFVHSLCCVIRTQTQHKHKFVYLCLCIVYLCYQNVPNIEADAKSGDGLYKRAKDSLCKMSEADQMICAMNLKARGPIITKEILAKRWGIGLDAAHRTLTATTQSGIRCVYTQWSDATK
jgi:hypothetical protein